MTSGIIILETVLLSRYLEVFLKENIIYHVSMRD